ncbi:unnamed protein product [Gordionus sp. m RMFG-2023]|uniref:syntaxin-5-like isoform X2 n=1 Tax=Gordionus sp. m RMFG-2023 TaxID=3053472 RepID=UPI0030E5DEC5
MDSKDRTFEFGVTIKALQSRIINGFDNSKPHSNSLGKQANMFGRIAKVIGKDLTNTYSKLEKLTLLASNKSLFDDKSQEIQELSSIIKQDISSMNSQLIELQKFLKQQKAHQTRINKHVEKHSNSILYTLQSKLASISNDFKNILEMRSENLKQQKTRQSKIVECDTNTKKFAHSLHRDYGEGSNMVPTSSTAPFMRFQKALATNYDPTVFRTATAVIPMPLQAQAQSTMRDQTDSLLESRAGAVQTIESTIVELGTIFTQLANMVKEQDEIIQRIDANVEETHFSIEAAHSEILRYFHSLSSNRWLMIKIFAILVIFVVLFVIFFA